MNEKNILTRWIEELKEKEDMEFKAARKSKKQRKRLRVGNIVVGSGSLVFGTTAVGAVISVVGAPLALAAGVASTVCGVSSIALTAAADHELKSINSHHKRYVDLNTARIEIEIILGTSLPNGTTNIVGKEAMSRAEKVYSGVTKNSYGSKIL